MGPLPAEMKASGSGFAGSYDAVTARRESEVCLIKEKLARNEVVDLPLCRLELVGDAAHQGTRTVKLGLKRGKLIYVFHNTHSGERDKHRNVITRARFIKEQLELAGYRLIPWDFKKGQPPRFWEGTATMDEEDDDLYGPSEETTAATATTPASAEPKKEDVKSGDDSDGDEPMDEGDESGDDASDSDDSDGVQFIIDRPPEAPKAPAPVKPAESRAIKIEAPPSAHQSTPSQQTVRTVPQLNRQPGTAYPAIKSSNLDVDADPVYPPLGKTVLQIDMDADLAEASKPWRLPGADQSDYFNYGFDEFTWEMYRQRQQTMASTLQQQKAETAQLQSFFGPGMGGPPAGPNPVAAGGPGPVPNAPSGPAAGGPGGGGGGPGGMGAGMMNEEMIQQAMAQMMQSGIDPSTMDFNAFMQMAGGMGGGGFDGGPQQQQGGYGGGGGRGGRRGGRGRGGW